ncbi:MAG: hypothetical protein CMK42_00055 [Porticoccaceae bacterium]|nr:hypothetical protein [Porticoccaceae bacterium]|tara:strand:+ start:4274 stop:4606 length:333 start_codon:yes stop_codon:yes gene_type:complete
MGGCDLHEAFHGLSKNIFQKRLTFLFPELILKYMMRTITIIWFSFLVMISVMTHNAMANEETWSNKINNWVVNEIEETKEYQKNSWAEGKAQLGRNWNSIKNLFSNIKAQ